MFTEAVYMNKFGKNHEQPPIFLKSENQIIFHVRTIFYRVTVKIFDVRKSIWIP